MGGSIFLASTVKVFRVIAKLFGVIAILVNMGAIAVAAFIALMLGGSIAEALVAIWQSLSLGKYMLNGFGVLFCFFTYSSMAAKDYYPAFLVPAIAFAVWDAMTFPHLLGYFYFAFWIAYSAFLIVNKRASKGGEEASSDSQESVAVSGEPTS